MNIEEVTLDYDAYEKQEFKLKNAIYIYQRNSHENLCIKHSVKSNGELGLGQPIDSEDFSKLLVNNGKKKYSFIPQRLLIESQDISIWWSQRQSRRMFFRISGMPPTIIKVIYPSLIWGVNKRSRSLFLASIANIRPTENSTIFHAPLMNINGNFQVCQGDATIPELTYIDDKAINTVEACIFDSNFSHVNYRKTLKGKTDISTADQFEYWKKKAIDKTVPRLAELNKAGKVSDFINKVKL